MTPTINYFAGVIIGAYAAILEAAWGRPLYWYSPLIWIVGWLILALIFAAIRGAIRRIKKRRSKPTFVELSPADREILRSIARRFDSPISVKHG